MPFVSTGFGRWLRNWTWDNPKSLGNVRCPTYWSREDDAFTKDWSSCGLLWCNPPFSLLGEVVNKLEREGAECILICPEWRSLAWFSKAEELMAKGKYYPPRESSL